MTTESIKPKIDIWGYNTIAKQLIAPIVLAVLMFALAGTTDWFWGWVFSIVHFLAWLMMTVTLIIKNPELLNARGKRRDDAKNWDKVILALYGINWIALILLAGLDIRYGWTGETAPFWHVLGNLLILIGFAITTAAMVVNRNFEVAVRIQADRQHTVTTGGLYQYVRHPGYTGVILAFYIGMPLALGSWAAGLMALIGVIIMLVRTHLEDQTLQHELAGYKTFTEKTRYRLIPYIW